MIDTPLSLLSETSRCSRCGACLAVCPIYGLTLDESLSARGKVALAEAEQQGLLAVTPRFKETFSACLLCGACEAACASGVGGVDTVLEQRARVSARGLLSLVSLGFKAGRPFMDVAAKAGSLAQELMNLGAEPGSGLLVRLTNLTKSGPRKFPELARTPFLRQNKGKRGKSKPTGSMRVAFFVGCGLNYLFPKAVHSVIRLLDSAGVEVVVPEGQHCCGMLIHTAGDPEAAKWLAWRNVDALLREDAAKVVTGCATCSSFFNRRYPELLGTNELPEVIDVASFLAGLGTLPEVADKPGIPLIYHDPCHLKISQGVESEPRDLLARFGYSTVEIPGESFCCGFGGTLNITDYPLSAGILEERMAGIAQVAKDAIGIATGCPGCLIQLGEGVWKTGLNLPVRHTVEWLADAVFEVTNKSV